MGKLTGGIELFRESNCFSWFLPSFYWYISDGDGVGFQYKWDSHKLAQFTGNMKLFKSVEKMPGYQIPK